MCTSPSRVNGGVVLVVQIWVVQVAKGFNLQLSVLEEVQLSEKRKSHKPQLKHKRYQVDVSAAFIQVQMQHFKREIPHAIIIYLVLPLLVTFLLSRI